jgi:hypothetical protein
MGAIREKDTSKIEARMRTAGDWVIEAAQNQGTDYLDRLILGS